MWPWPNRTLGQKQALVLRWQHQQASPPFVQHTPAMTEIKPACHPVDVERVVAIFQEDVLSPNVNLDFQDDGQGFTCLPGKYAAQRVTCYRQAQTQRSAAWDVPNITS